MSEHENYRDARTGQYVTDEYAKENPDTTVKESEFEGVPLAETPAIEVPLQSPPEVEDAEDSDPDSDR